MPLLGGEEGQNARISDVVLGRVLGSGGGELYANSPTIPGRRGSVRGGRGDREARLKFYRHLVGPVLDVNVMIPVCFFLHLQERGIMRTELFFCVQ